MKLVYKLLIIFLLPITAYAQDTTVVKKQANALAKAFIDGKYDVILDHTYPAALAVFGGREKMLSMLNSAMTQAKARGMAFEKAEVGSPGKFYKAGTEIQCILPENMTVKLNNGHAVNHTFLLAISKDHGKKWYFLDLNEGSLKHLHQVVPNLNPNMVIPEAIKPTFYSN